MQPLRLFPLKNTATSAHTGFFFLITDAASAEVRWGQLDSAPLHQFLPSILKPFLGQIMLN